MTGKLSKNFHGVGIGPLSKILAVKKSLLQSTLTQKGSFEFLQHFGYITFVLISACDVDGDGREEIYFLNTNTYSGASDTGELDKLFRFNDETGKFEDILTKDYNIGVLENLAGRSVACIDRKGNR